jgi:ribonuclease P protein component
VLHPRCYPPDARLKRPAEFRALLEQGEVFPGRVALVRRLLRPEGLARLGLSVPRGYGGAPRRNRFRRLAREAFRAVRQDLGPMDLLVSPRRGAGEPTLATLGADLTRAARARAGSGAPARTPRR